MANKQIMFDNPALVEMKEGVQELARAVKVTMGPTGRNVIIQKSFGGPAVTKDGVSVAKEVELGQPFENMGAKMVNEVAKKTADVAGYRSKNRWGWGASALGLDPRLIYASAAEFRPATDSPAVDSGDNAHAPALDISGVERPADGNGDGRAVVDRGAHELDSGASLPRVARHSTIRH